MTKNLMYGLRTCLAEDNVFYRDYTSKVRMELALSIGEEFKKFKWLFQELEGVGDGSQKKRQKGSITIYLDCEKAIGEFVHFIKNGRFGQMAKLDLQNAIKGQNYVPMTFWATNGGTMPAMLKGARNGKAEYRDIKLRRSSFNDKNLNSTDANLRNKARNIRFVLTVTACDGNVVEQAGGRKLITPCIVNGRPQNAHTINFMLTYEQLIAIAYAMESELTAYRTSQYVTAEVVKLLGVVPTPLDEQVSTTTSSNNNNNVVEPSPKQEVDNTSEVVEEYNINDFIPW